MKHTALYSLLLFFILPFIAVAQDHALDLEYQILSLQDIDKESGFDLNGTGFGVGYVGYYGLSSLAGEISIAKLEVERSQNDIVIETSDVYKLHLGGWNYVSGELKGFGIGGGTDIFYGEELFGFAGTVNAGYRLLLLDKFSIQPTVVGMIGFAYGREDLFDSFLGLGYNLKLKVGYNFY